MHYIMHTAYTSGLCASNGLTIVEHKTSMCMECGLLFISRTRGLPYTVCAPFGMHTFKAFETIIKTFEDS